jgi:NAD(P)-dependent dehydrogenase (short-subunit alcohol dehydrogenase family)
VGQKEQQLNRLQGKVAVITGGSSGMGLATAEQFVSEGAYVYITGRREKELDAAVAKIGRNIAAVQGDVSSLEDLPSRGKRVRSRLPVSREESKVL